MRRKGNMTWKRISALFLCFVLLFTAGSFDSLQVKAAGVFDSALEMELGDEITCYPVYGSDCYYKFTVSQTGIVKFDVESDRQKLLFRLYDEEGNSKTNDIDLVESKGTIMRNYVDSSAAEMQYELKWNTNVEEFEGSLSFELTPGDYCILLYTYSNDKGSPETTVSTTFKKTDASKTLDLNGSLTCYPAEGNEKSYTITLKEKGILTFNIRSEREEIDFRLYDSNGNPIGTETEKTASKGTITRKLIDFYQSSSGYRYVFGWNSTVQKIDGTVSFELAAGEYTVKLACNSNDDGSPVTKVITSFVSTETKAAKSIALQLTLSKGSSITLSAILNPTNSTSKVTWSSSKKTVCTVTSKGKVKAVAKGTCTITAKANGYTASIRIKVVN